MSKIIKIKEINPVSFGAPPRSKLGIDLNNNVYIVKNIKSRIIMKEGEKILNLAKKIKTKIYLATTAPICSKTKAYLEENQIKAVFNYIVK
jgi:hypothetical protein